MAVLAYHRSGLCIIPLNGKSTAPPEWKQYQSKRPTEDDLQRWQSKKLLKNIGVVCGAVSNNLIVLDFDGLGAYAAFALGAARGGATLGNRNPG